MSCAQVSCDPRQSMVGFELGTSRTTFDQVNEQYNDISLIYRKFGSHKKKKFPETSKILRNSGNPKKTKNRFDNFTKSI